VGLLVAGVDCLVMTGSFWCRRNTMSQLHGKERAQAIKCTVTARAVARLSGTELHKPKARKRVGFTVSGLAPKRSQRSRKWGWLAKKPALLLPINFPRCLLPSIPRGERRSLYHLFCVVIKHELGLRFA
jgi:hypothetical protein